MQETHFSFYEEFVFAWPTCKMLNLLDIYNMYIEYIKEASFYELTMRSSALERHPTYQG
jgi:hypothetical protein